MKQIKFSLGAIFLIIALSNCSDKEYRYVDLNSGKRINVVKDSANGYMINAETKEPVIIYYDTQTKDTVYGTTGEVINNRVIKTTDGKYEYTPVKPEVVEQKDKVKTQDELDLEKLNKYGNYKKKVTGDGDIKIKEGDTKIKVDGKTGEKTVKHD